MANFGDGSVLTIEAIMKRKNFADFEENGKKGDWCFVSKDTHIWIQFGDDNFKDSVSLPISIDRSIPGSWTWNGDKEKPTLTPSILIHAVEGWQKGWHGFLINGILVTC